MFFWLCGLELRCAAPFGWHANLKCLRKWFISFSIVRIWNIICLWWCIAECFSSDSFCHGIFFCFLFCQDCPAGTYQGSTGQSFCIVRHIPLPFHCSDAFAFDFRRVFVSYVFLDVYFHMLTVLFCFVFISMSLFGDCYNVGQKWGVRACFLIYAWLNIHPCCVFAAMTCVYSWLNSVLLDLDSSLSLLASFVFFFFLISSVLICVVGNSLIRIAQPGTTTTLWGNQIALYAIPAARDDFFFFFFYSLSIF